MRDIPVIIDRDIAEIYGVTTKEINQVGIKINFLQTLYLKLPRKRKMNWSQIVTGSIVLNIL
ncbi:MAG: ORF6N domain-containing protein [Rickettsiales bacterium]|nr:ORF6N domain-containing protein [Rickettsiales bacterium]